MNVRIAGLVAALAAVLTTASNVTPALANTKPVQQVAQVAATPLAQKPELRQAPAAQPAAPQQPANQHQAVAPVTIPTPTPPVRHTVPTAPASQPENVPAPVRTPSSDSQSPWFSSRPGQGTSSGRPRRPSLIPTSPVTSTSLRCRARPPSASSRPVRARASRLPPLSRSSPSLKKSNQSKTSTASCASNAEIQIGKSSGKASFDTSTPGCRVTFASYGKDTGKFLPQTLVSYATGSHASGHHEVSLPLPKSGCAYQMDVTYGEVITDLGHPNYYGKRLIATKSGGHGGCKEQIPPPVVKPPIDHQPPPVVAPPPIHHDCAVNQTRVDKCINNLPTPKPTSRPMQQVTAVNQTLQPLSQVRHLEQPQHLVAAKAVQPATRETSTITAPDTALAAQPTVELAETGAGVNTWLLVGLGLVLAGLLVLRLGRRAEEGR